MLEEEKIARRKRANEIRLNAVRDKARKTEIRHSQIKKSLGGLDESLKKATHIQFADSDDDSENLGCSVQSNIETEKAAKSKADNILGFENEDSDDEIKITVKPQFQGKEGEKLLQLQSSYGNDARFRLDKRFAEEEDDSTSDDELKVTRFYSLNPDAEENKDVKSELERNMEVLNQVIGHDVSSKEQTKKKAERFIDVSSRRYDPTKDDHLEVKVEKKKEIPKKKKKKKEKIEIVETDSRKFFDTSTDALRSAFAAKPTENNHTLAKESDEPFSFLAMLGRPNEEKNESESQEKKETENANDSRFSISSVMKKDMPTLKKEFRYDSSETEDEEEEVVDEIKDTSPERTESKVPQGSPPSHWPTTFFLTSQHDSRIAEGVKDFCWNKPFEQIQREWLEVKDTLMKDYKKKHRDARRKERKAKYEARLLAASTDT